jgi:hypothetical protein
MWLKDEVTVSRWDALRYNAIQTFKLFAERSYIQKLFRFATQV